MVSGDNMSTNDDPTGITYPHNPLASVTDSHDYQRSLVSGVLESYNSNYDFLAEALQNAVDAVEDAKLHDLRGPFEIRVTVNLRDNSVSVLDTGIGMTESDLARVLAPHVSLKSDDAIIQRRGTQHSYRGYKGVGLTLLAYGTDNLSLHSRREGSDPTALRMRYGNAWARGDRREYAMVDKEEGHSPLHDVRRGTFIRLRFSESTRPKSLAGLTARPKAWSAILRTRTAVGQVLIGRPSVLDIKVTLNVIGTNGNEHSEEIDPRFLFPHKVVRSPDFRFLDVLEYYDRHPEHSEIPLPYTRQDGVYLFWDTDRIRSEYLDQERARYRDQLDTYNPTLYAFVPYQSSVWGEINELLSESKARTYLAPGLVLAINRQRMADRFPLSVTRYETFSRNVFVAVHFDNAPPDQGRKTVQDEILDTARAAANRAVQYLAKQRSFLRPTGEAPSPQQRRVELEKGDWEFNVRQHQGQFPLHIPPVAYESEPRTEQDVIGLFHQLSALGLFPGIRFLATSQSQTYDSLVYFRCSTAMSGLKASESKLGLAPSVLGDSDTFETRRLTLEYKNNLDSLIADIEDESRPKQYRHIDVCVCWGVIQESFAGYELSSVGSENVDQRRYPGSTHFLQKDGDSHKLEVIMLSTIRDLLEAGELAFVDR